MSRNGSDLNLLRGIGLPSVMLDFLMRWPRHSLLTKRWLITLSACRFASTGHAFLAKISAAQNDSRDWY